MRPRIAFFLLGALLAAQAAAQTTTLTIDDAIRLAVAHNRQLEMARLEMDKADYRVNEAVGNALPTVSAAGQYARALKKPVFFLPDFQNPSSGRIVPIEIGADNSLQFGFTATQILFNSAVFTGVGASKIYQQASRELYYAAYNQTVANVKRAYDGALLMRDVLELTRASLKNAEDNLKTVQTMNSQGLVSDYDFIRAQVQVDNVRPSVMEAERNVVLAMNNIKLLLGMDPSATIELQGTLQYEPVDQKLVDGAEATAVTSNAGLKALALQKEVNQALVSISNSEWYPTLAAFGNYQWQAQKNSFRIGTDDLVASSQVGLSLSINLFNGMQSRARRNQAQVDYLKTEEQESLSRDGIRTNVQNIRLRLDEAARRIASQEKTVEQAERGYAIAKTRYAAGTGTQLEINDADLALMRARVNRVQAVFDYSIARVDLEEALSLVTPQDAK